MTDRELLDTALTRTGLSARALAALVRRNERTVRRWLDGSQEIDPTSRALLEVTIAAPDLVMETLGVHPRPPGWMVSATRDRRPAV